MSGFTKGPWDLTTCARLLNQWGVGDDLYLGSICSDGFPVCIVVLDGLERTEAKANADILAAAPELYEAGKRVTDAFRAMGNAAGIVEVRDARIECEQAMLALDAALSKATGGAK